MKKSYKSKPLFSIQCYEDRQHTLRLRKAAEEVTENCKENQIEERFNKTEKPPPPPPMPTNGHHNGEIKNGDLKQKTDETNLLKTPNLKKVATVIRTPTPDYNKDITVPNKTKNCTDGNADVDSLESYKLQNPSNGHPKPPSNYFIKAPNGTATMKKHSRPVSVTIGEYVNNMHSRREPSKLEFLNGDKKNGSHNGIDEDSITSRLQSELVMTLSRSNLRKKTEAMADGER